MIRQLTAFFVLALTVQVYGAQLTKSSVGDTLLHNVTFDEVTVLGNRQTEQMMHMPQSASVITSADIAFDNPATAADMLTADGILSVQKSQQGGGSPSIRGFESSRILIVIDGVKMNNLIYRAGHLQNIITVDPNSLSRAEVLYGPASVSYGSDALGGVVVMTTPSPTLAKGGDVNFFGNAMVRYGSVNDAVSLHTDFNIGGSKFASFTSVSFNKFGDLRSGRSQNPFMKDDRYIYRQYDVVHQDGKDMLVANNKYWHQPESGYNQYDLLQKFLYHYSDKISHALNLQFSNTNNVPRYDRLTDMKGDKPKFAEWYYGPQTRLLASYSLNSTNWAGADNASLVVSYQNIKESRHNRKLNDVWLGSRKENVNVLSLNSDWVKYFGSHRIHTGIDASLQYLKSTAYATHIDNGERKPLDTRYPDGDNHMHNVDLFVAHTWEINPQFTFTDGVRLGFSSLRSTFVSDEFFSFVSKIGTVQQDNPTYSLNAGLAYNPVKNWKFALNLATGYRVPNIDDLAKVFDSEPGMVVMPNPDIKPEKTISADLNVATFKRSIVEWNVSIFGTYLFDAISLAPAFFDGQSSILYDGELSNVYSNHNNSRAYAIGASTTVKVSMWRNFSADASVTYTYGNYIGRDGEKNAPLDHVAPLFGKAGFTFESSCRRVKAEFYSLFNGEKSAARYNLNGEDNKGYATINGLEDNNFTGLPAWFSLNLRISYSPYKNVTVQGCVENILDTEYRTFGSGINAPGRNFYTAIRISF